ncbi:MAG: endonuclease [Cypionkella sp.]|nr:endonuclease [Cypionkella sp.]
MTMPQDRALRIATYNVEWFTELFDDAGGFLNDNSPSVRHQTSKAQQFAAIGAVVQALDADALLIVEGPDHSETRSAPAALENFARHFDLRARRALVGFPSHTRQEIALLYDPDLMTAQHAPMGQADSAAAAPRFDFAYSYDLDGDADVENIGFSKPPLEAVLTLANGQTLRLIGVHTKSKAPRHTRGPAEFVAQSIQNRRKQLAECFWIRGRVDEVLAQNTPLIVLGDFNDGPGLDEYEQMFGYSSVEVVMGQTAPDRPQLFDPHAHKSARLGDKMPVTSRFYLPDEAGYFEALLDFIMVSPDLAAAAPKWRIWHPLHAPEITARPDLVAALLAASDHFPVSIDINLPLPRARA